MSTTKTMLVIISLTFFLAAAVVGGFEFILVKNEYLMPTWIHVELRVGQLIICFFIVFIWIKTYIELKRERKKI